MFTVWLRQLLRSHGLARAAAAVRKGRTQRIVVAANPRPAQRLRVGSQTCEDSSITTTRSGYAVAGSEDA